MTHSKASLLPAAVIALVFGLGPPDANLTGESFPFPNDWTLLAADETQGTEPENADESAKMGDGTHTGVEADTPESDT